MSTLYPPYLEGKLPAQIGDTLRIPFEHNRAVGDGDYSNIVLYIKNIYTNNFITKTKEETYFEASSVTNTEAIFKIGKEILTIGQYYKAQLAYLGEEGVGVSSTVGVFKYTAQPTVIVEQLNEFVYSGSYNNEKDLAEKVYSYRFDIYDDEDNLYETSGELIHNAGNDAQDGVSTDEFRTTRSLDKFRVYRVIYTVKTINDLIVTSDSKSISKPFEYPYNYEGSQLIVIPNNDEGYNTISIGDGKGIEEGYYRIMRSTDQRDWVEVCRRALAAGTKELFKDFTVDHAQTYYYYLQRFDPVNNIYAEPLYAEPVQNNFEDAFLSDGKRQLKIRFNPKVSSFKTTTLESKTDTIGGKHPFFFRNGNVGYKEFPISGMISLLMDDNSMFTLQSTVLSARETTPDASKDEIERATNLTPQNFYNERHFKLEGLEWLNNGEPKLFRSAAEGSYIVRLMNVSLSPNDTLGRMLHTFSSTAYEIADYNSAELKKLGFFEEDFSLTVQDNFEPEFVNFNFSDSEQEEWIYRFSNDEIIVKYITIRGAINAKVQIDYVNGESYSFNTGYVGYYSFPLKKIPLYGFKIIRIENSYFANCVVELLCNRTIDPSFKYGGDIVKSYEVEPQFIQKTGENSEINLNKMATYLKVYKQSNENVSSEFNLVINEQIETYKLNDENNSIVWTVKDFDYNYLPFDSIKLLNDDLIAEVYYHEASVNEKEVAPNA